jgi:transcriptional regulator of acetoin/glycerol metabolism
VPRRNDRARGPAPGARRGGGPRPDHAGRGELDAIKAALARHDGNVVAAADELGVSRSALYRRMEKFGL